MSISVARRLMYGRGRVARWAPLPYRSDRRAHRQVFGRAPQAGQRGRAHRVPHW